MVDALAEFSSRLSIPVFYVSFIFTPLVSNASELIAAVQFAGKKTQASAELTFSSLLGAVTMNNTFCGAIFLGLVAAQGLQWSFSAEVTTMVAVQVATVALAMRRVTRTAWLWASLALYPLSLLLVWVLENVAGWK